MKQILPILSPYAADDVLIWLFSFRSFVRILLVFEQKPIYYSDFH